jgi:hypothetical protein
MKLIKYRDAGLHTYTYFYIDENERICSPYFDSEGDAERWLQTQWDAWKAHRDMS